MHCDSERLAFYGRRLTTRLAGAGCTWVVNFFSLYFSVLSIFFNVGACTAFSKLCVHCIDQGSVLHVHAFRTACTVLIFVFMFLLLCNLFFQCMGVHCLVKHTCTALIMVLYCTFIYFRTTYIDRIFLFVFFLLCIRFFKFRGVHCLVNHPSIALNRVLYYMCTQSILHAQFSFLFSCFCSYVIFFPM